MITMSPCTTLAPRRPLGTSQLWWGHCTGHLAWCCPMDPPANLPQYTSAGIHCQHFQLQYQRNHRPYHVGLLQIDTFYLDTLSNISVNINGRHCMKHGNRQSTDALQQLSPAVGLRPGLGKVKVTVFRVTASSLSTPHTAHCALPLLAANHQLYSFSTIHCHLCFVEAHSSPVASLHTDTDKHSL